MMSSLRTIQQKVGCLCDCRRGVVMPHHVEENALLKQLCLYSSLKEEFVRYYNPVNKERTNLHEIVLN